MNYGTARLVQHGSSIMWEIKVEPHVAIRLKQVCARILKRAVGVLHLANTPENCRDLAWFCQRFPLEVEQQWSLEQGAKAHVDHVTRLAEMIAGHVPPPAFPMAIPPRSYQALAAQVAVASGGLLVGDDVGVGKTCIGIAVTALPGRTPAVVVVPAHLVGQWKAEYEKFAPHLKVFVAKGLTPRALGGADVVLINYHCLYAWAQVLAEYVRTVVYDEVHELRREESAKYQAAERFAKAEGITVRVGMSATPIYNYGGEVWTVCNILAPDRLGSWPEFWREWCDGSSDKGIVKDPEALGSYLRDQGILLRRTRKDVGRELPPMIKITQVVDTNPAALRAIGDEVRALAQILLGDVAASKEERFRAGGELDWKLRQATGIAKAPAVASFVRLLVEGGEKVLLAGWHHAVYDIWLDRLASPTKDGGAALRVAKFTGEESTARKAEVVRQWRAGELDVLIISLRSGAGTDGLQDVCHVGVVGELDWSFAVLEQLAGRLWRDGQAGDVVMYYLVAEDGADPVMVETLGLKRGQLDGIRVKDGDPITAVQGDGDHVKRLAAAYLKRFGRD